MEICLFFSIFYNTARLRITKKEKNLLILALGSFVARRRLLQAYKRGACSRDEKKRPGSQPITPKSPSTFVKQIMLSYHKRATRKTLKACVVKYSNIKSSLNVRTFTY